MTHITRIYVRRFSDTGQVRACAEWSDGSRTEGHITTHRIPRRPFPFFTFGQHMHALFQRARREGLRLERETF